MSRALRAIARTSLLALAFAACSAGGGNPVPYALSSDSPAPPASDDSPAPAREPSDDRSTAAAPTAAPTASPPPAAWDGTPYYDATAQACITTTDDVRNPCQNDYDSMTATPHGKLENSETLGYGQCGLYFTWYDYTTKAVRRCFYSASVKLLVGWQRWSPLPSFCGDSHVLQAGEVPDGCGPPPAPTLPDAGPLPAAPKGAP